LTKRLNEKGFNHFAQTTDIVKKLADQEFEAIGIAMIIATSLLDYKQVTNYLISWRI
jgi:hypothetical protein